MSAGVPSGRFIVLEGIDGSGTTSQAARLAEALRKRGREVVLTCEPTGGPIGGLIRAALQSKLGGSDAPGRTLGWSSMALLFAADRLDHLESEVLPALARGAIVISDRYYLSSLTYQSATSPEGQAAVAWLKVINALATRPDLTVVLDVEAALAAERRRARGAAEEVYERDALQEQLAALYARAERLLPEDRIVHVDGGGSLDEVFERILAAVDAVIRGDRGDGG